MIETRPYLYDAAGLAAIGRRDVQEDALALHFPEGMGLGYIVLSDGMGGHQAGDVASKIVVEAFLQEMLDQIGQPEVLERTIGTVLRNALQVANHRVRRYVMDQPNQRGMGATLVAPVLVRNRLYWISVGDSPLFLMRGDKLMRLNHEHSLAQRLDYQVQRGLISRDEAEQNPERHSLTSVVYGQPVPEIDCRDRALDLVAGDILVAASDGLLVLEETRIADLIHQNRQRTSSEICAGLLQGICDKNDPDQDNVTLCVVKIGADEAVVMPSEPPTPVAIPPRPAKSRRTTIQIQIRRNGTRTSSYFSSESEG